MAVTDGASVTETPRLKRGSMWYASAPFNSPIRGHYGFASVLGVGATLSACGAETSTRSSRARWGYEAGSSALQGGVAHLIILAIGDKGNKNTKIHKTVLVLSKLLNIQTDAFEGYSETVAERLSSRSTLPFFVKVNRTYKLTEQGRELYYKLLEQLRAKNREEVVKLLDILHRMSNKKLTALTYFLYPETTENSTVELFEKKGFKVEREGSEVTVEIP